MLRRSVSAPLAVFVAVVALAGVASASEPDCSDGEAAACGTHCASCPSPGTGGAHGAHDAVASARDKAGFDRAPDRGAGFPWDLIAVAAVGVGAAALLNPSFIRY